MGPDKSFPCVCYILFHVVTSHRSTPTKLDYDVLMAIDPKVDLSSYPNILKWYSLVRSYSEEERKR